MASSGVSFETRRSAGPAPEGGARPVAWALAGGAALALLGCVPEGPSTASAQPTGSQAARRERAGRSAPPRPVAAPSSRDEPPAPRLEVPFEDTFNRVELGPDWNALSPRWRIEGGRLCVRGAKNRGIWLRRRLPDNARIEFDAYAEAPEGDLKVELWGDGASGATGASYTDATSYVVILGGWRNTKHVLARLDEHGDDRLELDVDRESDDPRARPVEVGQPYRFTIERKDGRALEVAVNGKTYFVLTDEDPLSGPGHEHFGFNDWDAPACFDNLKITPL